MAQILVQQKRRSYWWLWLIILLIVLGVLYWMYTQGMLGDFNNAGTAPARVNHNNTP